MALRLRVLFLLALAAAMTTAVSACGRPLTRPDYGTATYDDDPLAGETDGAAAAGADSAAAAAQPPAPPSVTGTISRQALNDVLDSGPGAFLRRVQIRARVVDDQFGGWEITSFTLAGGVDLQPGDVVVGVNGHGCERPDEFAALWEALRFARELTVDYVRGDQRRALHFAITD